MLKLTKEQARRHREATDLIDSAHTLSYDEVEFVLTHWQEASTVTNPLDSAFFTPVQMAKDLALYASGPRVIDLCAGIGHMSWGFACRYDNDWDRDKPPLQLVCVEKNPHYVAVGRRLLPKATWICGDVFDALSMDLGRFDTALANPPFGSTALNGRSSPRYRGPLMEYHVIDLAAHLARLGVFIIPQASAPYLYSGVSRTERNSSARLEQFVRQTGIELGSSAIDATYYLDEWHGVRPSVEMVQADFSEAGHPASQPARPAVPAKATVLAGKPGMPDPLF